MTERQHAWIAVIVANGDRGFVCTRCYLTAVSLPVPESVNRCPHRENIWLRPPKRDNSTDRGMPVLCWFCDTCATMTLLSNAEAGRCIQTPRRADCPLPVPSITCPLCGAVSYNPHDIAEGYCGRCHDWTTPKPT